MGQGFAVFAGIGRRDHPRAARGKPEARGYQLVLGEPSRARPTAWPRSRRRRARPQRIALGVGVIPLHTRGPESIAAGRARHAPAARPPAARASAARTPRRSAACATASPRCGRSFTTRLIVAALGPKMCRLAGEVADGVLLNWLTPEHARRSADLVREGAAAAKRPDADRSTPTCAWPWAPAGREPARARRPTATRRIPAYGANFERMGVKPIDTAIAVQSPAAIATALARWQGAVDEVVLRAITANDTLEENLALVRAAKPA